MGCMFPTKIDKKYNILPQPKDFEYPWDKEALDWWDKKSHSAQCKLMNKYYPRDYYVKVTKSDGTCTLESHRQENWTRQQKINIWEEVTGKKSIKTLEIEFQFEIAHLKNKFIQEKYDEQNKRKPKTS